MNGHKQQCSCLATMQRGSRLSRRAPARAFTLIELLVVIAIIAILAAIILPVFAAIQENAREGNTMSHLHDISSGLALYKLDNKKYPPVLFAYACDAKSTDGCNPADTMATIAGDSKAKNELVGLYPDYVKDWHAFTCQNDPVSDPNGANKTGGNSGAEPQPNYLQPDGTLVHADGSAAAPYRAFFTADAFDVNPQILTTNRYYQSGGSYNYVIRYQTAWTSWDGNYDPDTDDSANTPFWKNYARQLQWTNPPANTYITAITDHVQNANRLIVLYESGTAKKESMQLGPWVAPGAAGAPGGWDETGAANQIGTSADRTSPGTIGLTSASGCHTQPGTTSPACSYVTPGFWQYSKGG